MAFEAPKATPRGMEHRYGQFRIVTILNQFLNDLTLLGIEAARIDHAARCRGSPVAARGAGRSHNRGSRLTVFLVRTRISVPSAPDQGWTKADRHFVFRAARAARPMGRACGATERAPCCERDGEDRTRPTKHEKAAGAIRAAFLVSRPVA
jgi:hypothetical protein